MKKRLLSLLLAVGLLGAPARAAENSMANFARPPDRVYDDRFPDVPKTHTHYHNIAALWELGLTRGKADGTFGPGDTIPLSQAVIFAGRLRSLYRTGDPEIGPGAHAAGTAQAVALPYLRYLQAEGLVGAELDGLLHTPATRAQVAHLLANLLPEAHLPAINGDAVAEGYARRAYITDVTDYTPYQADILRLYRCGIVQGSGPDGAFLPEQAITRGAVAAMLTRLAVPALRVRLDWNAVEVPDVSAVTLAGLIAPGKYVPAPATAEELDSTLREMLARDSDRLRLAYPGLTVKQSRELMQRVLVGVKSYCEQGYNTVTATVDPLGVELVFSASGAEGRTAQYRAGSLAAAKAVHDRLWAGGQLLPSMTEAEKALVYYRWLCANCDYDHGADDDSLSHIPYSLFTRGLAVCDGYTGAYNLLLKLEGIACRAYLAEGHIWTVATLDGREVHIDPTWGDVGADGDPLYFAMSEETSLLLHRAVT